MKRYIFLLGRKQDLCFAELECVLNRFPDQLTAIELHDGYALVEVKAPLDPQIIKTLGGTVKIVVLGKPRTSQDFIGKIVAVLKNESLGRQKLVFGVSTINPPAGKKPALLSKLVKEHLEKENISSRYVLARKDNQLSSSQVKLNHLTEIYLVWKNSKVEIGKTIAVQDFEGFASRDYDKPFAAPKKGMLPPKVARMMVNLAFSSSPSGESWILDPFCGTGSIALEALEMGINCIVSDHSSDQIQGASENIKWLLRKKLLKVKWSQYLSDATKISQKLRRRVDAVVTEPYLGPPDFPDEKIPDIVKGLNKLYLGAIKDWFKCLKQKGRVVMVIPEIKAQKFVKIADLIIDRCENLGYTLVVGPLEYSRPNAKVVRQIIVFQKK